MKNNDGMKPIGLRIKARREDLGLTQEELAQKLGYKSKSSLNKIELGVQGLRQSKIKAIADALQTTPGYIMGWSAEKEATAPPADPAQDYARLIAYLDSHPEHRQLVSDALKVRTEDIDMIRPLLKRCADPDSTAPNLDTCKSSQGTNSDTLDTLEDTSRRITLTDENLALVRDTPEVLAAEAEYIKKTSERPARRATAPSPSTEDTGRKSG